MVTNKSQISPPRSIRGFWYTGKTKKGGKAPPVTDVVDGKMIWDKKLRYSYGGKEKYEYEKWDQVNPHFGKCYNTIFKVLLERSKQQFFLCSGQFDSSSALTPGQLKQYQQYLRESDPPAISLHVKHPFALAENYYNGIMEAKKRLGSNHNNHPLQRWWPYSGSFFSAHEFRLMGK